MSTTTRVSTEKQREINQGLIAGESIKDVAAKTGETYNVVASFRRKLADAKIVPQLYKAKADRNQPIAKAKRVWKTEAPTNGLVLKVNGVVFNINDATSVNVSKDGVEVTTN